MAEQVQELIDKLKQEGVEVSQKQQEQFVL